MALFVSTYVLADPYRFADLAKTIYIDCSFLVRFLIPGKWATYSSSSINSANVVGCTPAIMSGLAPSEMHPPECTPTVKRSHRN